MCIVPTPVTLGSVRARPPVSVVNQQRSINQSTPLLPPHSTSHLRPVSGVRAATPQPNKLPGSPRPQGPRLQRNDLATRTLQQQLPQQDEQQSSYQDHFLKRLEKQKGTSRSKINKSSTAQQRVMLSQQLGIQQQQKQQVI